MLLLYSLYILSSFLSWFYLLSLFAEIFFVSDRSRSNRWTHSFDRWIACFYFLDRYLDRQTDGQTDWRIDREIDYCMFSVPFSCWQQVRYGPFLMSRSILCVHVPKMDGRMDGYLSIHPSRIYTTFRISSHPICPSIHRSMAFWLTTAKR